MSITFRKIPRKMFLLERWIEQFFRQNKKIHYNVRLLVYSESLSSTELRVWNMWNIVHFSVDEFPLFTMLCIYCIGNLREISLKHTEPHNIHYNQKLSKFSWKSSIVIGVQIMILHHRFISPIYYFSWNLNSSNLICTIGSIVYTSRMEIF